MYSNLEEGTRAGELYKKHRILCWVLTGPANHEARNINLDNSYRYFKTMILLLDGNIEYHAQAPMPSWKADRN